MKVGEGVTSVIVYSLTAVQYAPPHHEKQRDSLRTGGVPQTPHRGALSPGEAPGPPRSQGASLFLCLIIRRGGGSTHSSPGEVTQSRPSAARGMTPVTDHLPAGAPSIIGGYQRQIA
jgi:hypothetical protein